MYALEQKKVLISAVKASALGNNVKKEQEKSNITRTEEATLEIRNEIGDKPTKASRESQGSQTLG